MKMRWCLVALSLTGAPSLWSHPGGVDEKGCHKHSATGLRHCHAERAVAQDEQAPPSPGDEGVFFGPYVAIVDGDSFKAKIQGVVMDFRLEGVDAPERDQAFGEQSREILRSLIEGRELVLVPSDTDRYGRTVVRVWVGALAVNRELVARGAAWFDPEYSSDDGLYREELAARDAQRGLWALPFEQRIEPWEWRRRK